MRNAGEPELEGACLCECDFDNECLLGHIRNRRYIGFSDHPKRIQRASLDENLCSFAGRIVADAGCPVAVVRSDSGVYGCEYRDMFALYHFACAGHAIHCVYVFYRQKIQKYPEKRVKRHRLMFREAVFL